MTPLRLAVAGRYVERHAIKEMLARAKLDVLPVVITASWMDGTEEADADLTDAQAVARAQINRGEIASAHALIYVPSWCWDRGTVPNWSPGRLIDFGIAFACRVPIIVVGMPEPTIYQRGELVTVCTVETLRETVQKILSIHED